MSIEDEINKNIRKIQGSVLKPFYHDHIIAEIGNPIMANSAFELQREEEKNETIFQEIAERQEKYSNAIQQTAEASVVHTKLLEKQLEEEKMQNATLNALYEQAKQEAEENKVELQVSRKAMKKANRLSILAIAVSSIFSALSIVASVLIALYL